MSCSINLLDRKIGKINMEIIVKGDKYPVFLIMNEGETVQTVKTESHLEIKIEPHTGVCLLGGFGTDMRNIWTEDDEPIFLQMVEEIEQMSLQMDCPITILNRTKKDSYVLSSHMYLEMKVG